jgi:hypothetical protein
MASKIKEAIQYPFYADLNKIKVANVVHNVHKAVGLSDFLCKREIEMSEEQPRHFIHEYSVLFETFYGGVIFLLAIIIYWLPLIRLLHALLFASNFFSAFSAVVLKILISSF